MNLKDLLKSELSEKELEIAPRAYEVIGDIAIIEIPEDLESKETLIAETLLKNRKNIRTVVKKGSDRSGDFRLKEYIVLAGEDSLETVHIEHGCRFFLNVSEAYFSSREGTERERISNMVEEGERIAVLGAGIGPFPIVIAKNNDVDIIGIDINPDAIKCFETNIEKNKLKGKTEARLSDIREFSAHHQKEFDRVLVTMPQQAKEFVDVSVNCVKDGGVLHLYLTEDDDKIDGLTEDLAKILEKTERGCKIGNMRQVLPYSPRRHKVCFDIVIY